MTRACFVVAMWSFFFVTDSVNTAVAVDLKLFCPVAIRGAMSEIAPQFERSAGHKAIVEYATVGVIVDRLLKGDAGDVAITSAPQFEDLQKQGKIVAGSRVDVARVGVGAFVRAGAPKPDISSADAFRRTLLAAKSVGYGDPAAGGVSGVHMAGLVERLGIASELKPKTKLLPNSQAVLAAIAKGEVEIAIGLTSDTALVSGVDLVGALPADIQNFTLYAVGILASSKQMDAGKAFISHLSAPAAKAVLKAKGFEPR